MKITATYEIEDGYVGKSAPHDVEIEVDEEEWNEMTDKEREELIERECGNYFKNNISFSVTRWEADE